MSKNNKLKEFLKNYSLDDVAKSFLALSLWLPNISSQIKMQYIHVVLESCNKELSFDNKIKDYKDFEIFCKKLLDLIPSFPMLEDYLPEADWGEIKFYLEGKFYKIFYGGDLSNPYDFYYSYELIHGPFVEKYINITGRSPINELRFNLKIQDFLLAKVPQVLRPLNINPGHMETPSKDFWNSICQFVDDFDPNFLDKDILDLYTNNFDSVSEIPLADFEERAFNGQNCRYFFIKNKNKYYPVIPRRWLSVMYDAWGDLLNNNYESIKEKLKNADFSVIIGIKLSHFIRERVRENKVFPLVNVVDSNLHKVNELIFTGIHAENKIFLIHVTPPLLKKDGLTEYIKDLENKLLKCKETLLNSPTRLGLIDKNQIVEFVSEKNGGKLEPVFIVAIPSPLTSTFSSMKMPEGIRMEIMTLDQISGIFDEVENLSELSNFFDNIEEERNLQRIPGIASYLDRWGSFKDSSGTIVPGAIEPNLIMLDLQWGSGYRFKKLKKFWSSYPETRIFDHPRSWKIASRKKRNQSTILSSRNMFGYVFYKEIGAASLFINAPVHKMNFREGCFNDSIMQSLSDSLDLYSSFLLKLNFVKHPLKIQIFFCSSDVANKNEDLKHLRDFVDVDSLWAIDHAQIGSHDYGIRVVYNRDILTKALSEVQDRRIQIDLLEDVLDAINALAGEPMLDKVKLKLEKEKTKKPRFKTFSVQKIASFPEGVSIVVPDDKDFKIADKKISKMALEAGISPGTYSANDGIIKLNNLREKVIDYLNKEIKQFNFKSCIPELLEKSNALIYDSWVKNEQVKASVNHEVDFERGEMSGKNETKFLHAYRNYRYLIEKFVQLHPNGDKELSPAILSEFLAVVDRLLEIYSCSDFIKYELFKVNITIDRDYLVSIKDEENDIRKMEKNYAEEQAKLSLGIMGNEQDTVDSSIPVAEYLENLDKAFEKDLGFGLKNMINLQQVLAIWPENEQDKTYYFASKEQITDACKERILGYNIDETEKILDFLTLKREEILKIKDDPRIPNDLPVWEHNKRLMRLDIRPLIKIDNNYFWGPLSIERSSRIWMGISHKHKLPSEMETATVNTILRQGHSNLERNLAIKIRDIALRYTDLVKMDVFLHDHDDISDIGDVDILVFLKDKNIILNIESKIIDPPHCNKDAGRMQRKIYGETKEDGSFKKGYLQRVEEREKYLKKDGKKLIEKLGWGPVQNDIKIISIFTTKMGYWWTKFPPIKTEVKFIEVRLLDDFIKNL